MRLRVCIVLAALAGAAGSMILAVDSYRRLGLAERFATPNTAGVLVFGMAHALGNAGAGALFLSIGLLALSEKKKSSPADESRDAIDAQKAGSTADSSPIPVDTPDLSITPIFVADGMLPASAEVLPKPTFEQNDSAPIPVAVPSTELTDAGVKPPFRPAKNIYIVEIPAHTDEGIALQTAAADVEFRRSAIYEKVAVKPEEIETLPPTSAGEPDVVDAASGAPSIAEVPKPEAPTE